MNNVKQGYNAGQSTRKVVNNAARSAADHAQTVTSTVGGFIKGFFSNPDEVAVKATPKRKTAKRK